MELPNPAPASERPGAATTESQAPSKNSDKQSEDSHLSPLPTLFIASRPPSFPPSDNPGKPPRPTELALGGSCCSSEQGQSIENRKTVPAVPEEKFIFTLGGSSREENSLKSTAVNSNTEAEDVDESAIDDDDGSSDWEDSEADGERSPFDKKMPPKVNLTSRPSLISLMMAQNKRAKELRNHASKSTSDIPKARAEPSAPSLGGSPNNETPLMNCKRRPALKPIARFGPEPIAAGASHAYAQAASSPQTTHQIMVATELTESLRRYLLRERQQNPCMKDGNKDDAISWNQYFSKEALNGYHSKGW